MKINEEYWYNLYKEGKIEIDFENGIVYSYLNKSNRFGEVKRNQLSKNAENNKNKYCRSSAGPSREERYHILLHRLIYICYYGEIPEDIEVNHKNGIKWDNRIANLELVNKSENAIHSRRVLGNKGGVSLGENSGVAKLNWEKVDKIRELWMNGGIMHKELAVMFDVSKSAIIDVLRCRTWKYMELHI